MSPRPPTLIAVALCALLAPACATKTVASKKQCELVLAYDDSRTTGTLNFPSTTYESVLRFELPDGEHRPLRLRLQAGGTGALAITIYDTTVLETPGEPIAELTRELDANDVSDGKDGRWIVEELHQLKPFKGVVWVGIKKAAGEPVLWASSASSGQTFIRNNDPQNLLELLPTKRTPMVRLELAR